MNATRIKIINAAIELFNEHGTDKVSTNHICEKISISPGNLYYHFRSKKEIIVSIFQKMIEQWESTPVPADPALQNLFFMYEQTLDFLWNYRFIHREINSLFHGIDSFKKIFKEAQKRRLKEIQNFINLYSHAGILKKMQQDEIETLTRTIWFFSLYWISYLETEGKKIDHKTIQNSVHILKNIVQPYIIKGI